MYSSSACRGVALHRRCQALLNFVCVFCRRLATDLSAPYLANDRSPRSKSPRTHAQRVFPGGGGARGLRGIARGFKSPRSKAKRSRRWVIYARDSCRSVIAGTMSMDCKQVNIIALPACACREHPGEEAVAMAAPPVLASCGADQRPMRAASARCD